MKTYDRAGTRTITRRSAMAMLALGTLSIAAAYEHPNYHVRRAAFLADDMALPINGDGVTDIKATVDLFKSVQPNLFTRVVAQKARDAKAVKDNEAAIKSATDHNTNAALLREAEAEKFATLAAWLPIYRSDLHKFGADPKNSQAEFNERAATAATVDAWLRECCDQPIPEVFEPMPDIYYAIAFCDTDAGTNVVGARFLMVDGLVAAMPSA